MQNLAWKLGISFLPKAYGKPLFAWGTFGEKYSAIPAHSVFFNRIDSLPTFAASASHPSRGGGSRHSGHPQTGLGAALPQVCSEPKLNDGAESTNGRFENWLGFPTVVKLKRSPVAISVLKICLC
jgi:hypothetical protein